MWSKQYDDRVALTDRGLAELKVLVPVGDVGHDALLGRAYRRRAIASSTQAAKWSLIWL